MREKRLEKWCSLIRYNAVPLGVLAGVCAFPGFALGGDWSANFSTMTNVTHNNNPSLATEDVKGRTDFTVNRSVDAEYAKDRYRVGIVGQANIVASQDEIAHSIFAADQVRYDLNVDGEYDFDKSVIAAAFGLGFDSVQNTEFQDTGQLTNDVTRTNSSLNLSYSRQLNELWGLNISNIYSIASYSGGNFTGYSNNSTQFGFSNAFSERLSITPSISYSRYMPDSNALKPSGTIQLQVGGSYELSDVDSLEGSLGIVRTGDSLATSVQFGYRQEIMDRLTASATIDRNHTASGSGNVLQSTSLGGGLSYQLDEMIQLGLDASLRKSSQVGASGSAVTTQFQIDPSIGWTINDHWRANLNLQNRQQKQPTSGTASSNSVIFALNYNLPLE